MAQDRNDKKGPSTGSFLKRDPMLDDSTTPVPLPDGSRFAEWAPDLGPEKLALLRAFLAELFKFNKKLNLISSLTASKADSVHVMDAVNSWKIVAPRLRAGSVVHDLGSGNGIPGLIYSILAPDIKFVMVDRDQRKLEFCKHVGSALGLKNANFSSADIDTMPEDSIDIAVSRGFAPVSKSLLLTRKIIKKGGRFYMLKGEGWAREVAEIPTQIFGFWQVEMIGQYQVPDSRADYVVIESKRTN